MLESVSASIDRLSKEVASVNRTLLAIWSLISNEESGLLPFGLDTEYISIEECAQRLDVSERTIRNWILQGKKNPAGWIQGVHYITLPSGNTSGPLTSKATIRIPWNTLIKDIVLHKQDQKATLKNIQEVLAPREASANKEKFF